MPSFTHYPKSYLVALILALLVVLVVVFPEGGM